MRFFGTTIVKYAVVETDDGMFRVDSDGSLTKHDSETEILQDLRNFIAAYET